MPKSALFLLAIAFAFHPESAYGQDIEEGEVWSGVILEAPILELNSIGATKLRLEEGNRWKDRYSEYYRNHHQVSVILPIPGLEGWTWEPAYRRQVVEPGSDRQIHINRYMLHLNWKKEGIWGSPWDFYFRNRWEVHDVDNTDEEIHRARFRGKIKRELPNICIQDRNWKIWLFDELFYDWDVDLINENRLAAGVTIPLYERMDLSFGGQWRTRRVGRDGAEWDDDHMILVNLKYTLP